MSTSAVALIFGAGPKIGAAVAKTFAAKGYKIAMVSRSASSSSDTADRVNVSADFSNPSSVSEAYSKVKTSLGTPSVVIFNVGALTPTDGDDPLGDTLSLEAFSRDVNIGVISSFVAAKEAVKGFKELGPGASRTFIYTGNILNTTVIPPLLTLGVGKSGGSHIVQAASVAYKDKGYKFYYVDERQPDGTPVYSGTDGPAHAEEFLKLAETKEQGPWDHTFVKGGVGYKEFK